MSKKSLPDIWNEFWFRIASVLLFLFLKLKLSHYRYQNIDHYQGLHCFISPERFLNAHMIPYYLNIPKSSIIIQEMAEYINITY